MRYADDFVIFTKSQAAAQRVYRSVERFLSERLKLIVNHNKSSIRLMVLSMWATNFVALAVRFASARRNWLPSSSVPRKSCEGTVAFRCKLD